MPRGKATPYFLLLPFFLFLLVFWIIPLAGGIQLSLYSDELFGPGEYIGAEHYQSLISDQRYFKAVKNTVVYAAATIIVVLPLALGLAEMLRMSWRRWRPMFTFLLLLPGLTPPAVLALLFLLVFHGREGLLNQLFVIPLGFEPINWLRDPDFILPALVIQAAWRWTGFITFFLLAGMEAIPRTLYEAAALETQNRWRIFRHLTLPLLRLVLLFVAVYLVVDGFSLFSGAYVLLGGSGGTSDAGLLLISYTYQNAFGFGKFGTAAAMSLLIAPFLLGILGLCFLWPRNEVSIQ